MLLSFLGSIIPSSAEADQPLSPPDPNQLGGVVISQLPISHSGSFVGSPSIVVMQDGTYIASHDLFIRGAPDPVQTFVFRSNDKGRHWTHVSTLESLMYGTLFASGRFLYILGANGDDKAVDGRRAVMVVQKSTDKGSSWGAAHQLMPAPKGITPSPPVIFENRIWFAYGARNAMSASLDDSVLDKNAWTVTKNSQTGTPEYLLLLKAECAFQTEAQIVASPQTGVVLMPKTNGLPITSLIRVSDANTATFDVDNDLVSLPGAEKKFACVYDPVSEKFYALTNPVLSQYRKHETPKPNMIRNTGAVLSSTNLKDWRVEKIFLHSPDIDHEGFQYFNFAIDGDDLAVVSRTAISVDRQKPPRGHDANILSFHVIKDFRNLQRKQVLVADTAHDRVLRFEANLTSRLAPLGGFDGMTRPMGIAQGPDGDLFIGEQIAGGRILRFSSTGNTFRGVVATGDVDFTGNPESLIFGPDGHLYMSVAFGARSNKIYKIDTDTNQVTLFVPSSFTSSAGTGTLNEPRGIAVGPDGHLYVADRANDRIRRFDGATGEFMGNLTTDQRQPQALAWDETGRRFLFSRRTSKPDHDIARALLSGRVRTLYTEHDIGHALGIQSLEGRVYWTDFNKNKIYVSISETEKTKATSVSAGLKSPGNMALVLLSPTGL